MEKEREQSILYGMGEELIICPVCEGKHMVEKKSSNGEIHFYSDRITVIKEPCPRCNGVGFIMKGGKK